MGALFLSYEQAPNRLQCDIPERARISLRSSALERPALTCGDGIASIGETTGVGLEVMGGDGARDGRKGGTRDGVREEDAKVWRNRTESYLRDSTGCVQAQ